MDRRAFVRAAMAAGVAGSAVGIARRAAATVNDPPTGFENVLAYGADPTGANSSTTAFQSAVTQSLSNGCPVWIPPGTYDLLSLSGLSVGNGQTLELVGAGRDQVTLLGSSSSPLVSATSGSGIAIKMSGVGASGFLWAIYYGTGAGFETIEVRECRFWDLAAQVVGSGGGIYLDTIEHFIFVDNIAENIGANAPFAAAVKLGGDRCRHALVERNVIRDVGPCPHPGQSHGIYLAMANGTDFIDNRVKSFVIANDIRGVTSASGSYHSSGIMVLGGGQTVIQGNHVEDVISSAVPAVNKMEIYTKCNNSVISGNTLVNCAGYPGVITVKGTGRGSTEPHPEPGFDNVICSNTIRIDDAWGGSTRRVTGIAIINEGCIVSDNSIIGTQGGVSVEPGEPGIGSRNLTVKGNLIFGLKLRDVGLTVHGVLVTDPYDVLIVDNQIVKLDGTTQSGNYSAYGIHVKTSANAASRGCLIRGNWIADLLANPSGFSRGIMVTQGASSTTNKLIIESNHVDNVGDGIYVTSSMTPIQHSAARHNTISNSATTITPASGSWTIFEP